MSQVTTERFIVTADTSTLPKAANDVQRLGSETGKASAILAAAKGSMPTAEYKALAASLAPAIAAEKDLARVARETERALRPMIAEQRKIATEHLKADAILQKRALSEQKAANALRMRHDTEYRNAQSMMKVRRDVTAQVERGNLSMEAGNTIIAGATTRYRQLGTQARLTQNQLLNLSRQANDSITMAAMGMSPGMIIASQAGQIFGALEENQRGVRGSIEAIGSSIAGFARAIPPAAIAVAGLTAATSALYFLTRGPAARSAEESVASFDSAVASLEAAWEGAGEAAERHYENARRSGDTASAALLNVGGDIRDLQADLQATIRDLNTSDRLSAPIIWQSSSEQSAARREITALYAEARVGKISVSELADEMLRIRLDPSIDNHARAFTDEIRRALPPAEDLERRIQALNVAAAKMAAPKGTMGRYALPDDVFDSMFGGQGESNRFGPGMDSVRESLRGQRAEFQQYIDAATDAQNALANFDLSPIQRQIAETNAEYDRQVALLSNVEDSSIALLSVEQAREAALGLIRREAAAAEQQRRDNYELDLRAVTARTAAEETGVTAERARIERLTGGSHS